jgi:hypothetical protein
MNVILKRLLLAACLLEAPALAGAQPVVCRWTGGDAFSGLNWNNTDNWADCRGSIPRNGDSVVSPAGATKPNNNNNIVGLQLTAVSLLGRVANDVPWNITGNAITMNGGAILDLLSRRRWQRHRVDRDRCRAAAIHLSPHRWRHGAAVR